MGFVGDKKQRSVCCRNAPVGVETGGGREDSQSSDHGGGGGEERRRARLGKQPGGMPPHACGYVAQREGSTNRSPSRRWFPPIDANHDSGKSRSERSHPGGRSPIRNAAEMGSVWHDECIVDEGIEFESAGWST